MHIYIYYFKHILLIVFLNQPELFFVHKKCLQVFLYNIIHLFALAQSVGPVEYTDFFSAEG